MSFDTQDSWIPGSPMPKAWDALGVAHLAVFVLTQQGQDRPSPHRPPWGRA
jgi:hypothetical protein